MAGFVGLDGLLGGVISGLFGIGQQAMANSFAKKEAAKDRDFQSDEAEKNRDFQSDEAAAQRDWSSQENELNRLFNANEAALQRDWSAAEAEQARDWQEEMYAKYNSLSGKISQAEQAGVNPMFAISGNAVTPMSASSPMPSGSAASGSMSGGASASGSAASGSRASAGLVNILGGILDGLKLKSEIALNESQANKNNAEAEGQKITNEQLREMNAADIMSKLSQVELNDANIELIASKILNTDADTHVKGAQLGQIASQIKNTNADTDVKLSQVGLIIAQTVKENKSLDVMSAQIAEMASNVGLNREKGKEIAQNVRNLVQQYGHDKVMNSLNEIIASSEASMAYRLNPDNYEGVNKGVRQFLNEFKQIFSFSGTTSPK